MAHRGMASRGAHLPLALWLLVAHAGCRFDKTAPSLADATSPGSRDWSLTVALDGRHPDATAPDLARDLRFPPPSDQRLDNGCSRAFQCSGDSSQVCLGPGSWSAPRKCHRSCDLKSGLCDGFKPSNGIDGAIQWGYGRLDISSNVVINTDTCQLIGLPPGSFTQKSPEGCVLVVGELLIRSAGSLTASGTRPLIVAASGVVKIEGTIDVSAHGSDPGPGGGRGGEAGVAPSGGGDGDGAGCGGGPAGDFSASLGALGGAGGSFGSKGGNGGGRTGVSSPGPAARAPCLPSCADLIKGGSGGGAGAGNRGSPAGGGGGGGLQISSLLSIEILGTIHAGGGGGGPSSWTDWGSSGAGGGSGGGVLLESFAVSTGGKGLVAANGGGGSSGGPLVDGKPGADASASVAPAMGGQATSGFGGAQGGAGGAGSGADPTAGDGAGVPAAAFLLIHFAGGGGGGAGRICVRVEDTPGALSSAEKGKFSPSYVDGSPWPTHIETL